MIASSGFFSWELSNFTGMLLRKKKYRTRILAPKENKVGISIRPAYSIKVIPKKSADTILTRLLTTSGKEVVSAMNPLAIMNGKTFFSSKLSARTIASTIGVKMSAAPSLAKNADTIAPSMVT
ncbi:hypothetical protein D3C81_1582720 [compost metagenome]